MVTRYIEQFTVANRVYGIEDYQDARPCSEHFFMTKHKGEDKENRYALWAGGCGIGPAKTIEEARMKLHNYIIKEQHKTIKRLEDMLAVHRSAVTSLGTDPFYLGKFAK